MGRVTAANLLAVCDRCRVKEPVAHPSDSRRIHEFLHSHAHCNFTGCRVVLADNPCPNRARHYRLEAAPGG